MDAGCYKKCSDEIACGQAAEKSPSRIKLAEFAENSQLGFIFRNLLHISGENSKNITRAIEKD